jgi:hypothetical protein
MPRDTTGHISMPPEANATPISIQLSIKNFTSYLSGSPSGESGILEWRAFP